MVVHQCVGVDGAVRFHRMTSQPFQVGVVVLVDEEAGLPVMAALDQVNGHIGEDDAGMARHDWIR